MDEALSLSADLHSGAGARVQGVGAVRAGEGTEDSAAPIYTILSAMGTSAAPRHHQILPDLEDQLRKDGW